MRSQTVTSAAIAALILVALFAVFIRARGFRASSTPGAFETSAAPLVRDFAILRAAKGQKNPLGGDEQAVGQGRKEFITPAMSETLKIPNACTGCHTDRSNEWATEALRGWTGLSPWRAFQ
jgi:hypothetical protein